MPLIPKGLFAAAFLFWGYASGEWLFALLGTILLELPQWMGWHREIAFSSHRRAWLITLLSMWALVIFGALEFNHAESIRFILKWAPFALIAMPLTSICSVNRAIPISVFFVLLQKSIDSRTRPGVAERPPAIDPGFPFLCILLLATAYQNPPTQWFFPIATALLVWPFIYQARQHGRRRLAIIATLALVAISAHGMHIGFSKMHRLFEDRFLRGQTRNHGIYTQTQTQIGNISEIKLSHNIRWRAKILSGKTPTYLRQASYNLLILEGAPTWRIADPDQRIFTSLEPEDDAINPTLWPLEDASDGGNRLHLRGRADPKWTVMPLPDGSQLIADMPSLAMHRNPFGTVRVDSAYPLISCIITAGNPLPHQPPPPNDIVDLEVPSTLEATLDPLVSELELRRLPPEQAIERIVAFFASEFSYSLDLQGADISTFLLDEKAGHCEYFATATVVLLRMAGIPARYNVGFYLKEYDPGSEQFLLRGSHAHAWATAWVDGHWQTVETTPPDWFASDTAGAPFWQGLHDWWGGVSLSLMEWRSQADPFAILADQVPTIAFLLFAYVLVRLYLMQRKRRKSQTVNHHSLLPPQSFHSPWLDILPLMEKRLGKRPDYLPCESWVLSLEKLPTKAKQFALALIAEHNQRRFGPHNQPQPTNNKLNTHANELKDLLENTDPPHQ